MTFVQFLEKFWPHISALLVIEFTCFVNALPEPTKDSSASYVFWYTFLHNQPLPTYTHRSVQAPLVLEAPKPITHPVEGESIA